MAHSKEMTLLQLILENHNAVQNHLIRVWIDRGTSFSDSYFEGLDRWNETECLRLWREGQDIEAIPAHQDLCLVPGQFLLRLHGSGLNRQTLVMFSFEQPFIDLPNGRFIAGHIRYRFDHMALGDGRYYSQAAKRAMKETGNKDWIGGIADFATRFVRPARATRAAQAAAERQASWKH